MAEHWVYFCGKHGRYSQTGKVVTSCMANKINRIFFCDTCENLKLTWNKSMKLKHKQNDDLKEKATETEIFVRVFQENDGFIFISKTDRRLTMGHMAT